MAEGTVEVKRRELELSGRDSLYKPHSRTGGEKK
jgi:hypothetical protein